MTRSTWLLLTITLSTTLVFAQESPAPGSRPIRFRVSFSSASISSTVGKADCNAFGRALVNSYVEMPIGLSMPAKLYSASSRS